MSWFKHAEPNREFKLLPKMLLMAIEMEPPPVRPGEEPLNPETTYIDVRDESGPQAVNHRYVARINLRAEYPELGDKALAFRVIAEHWSNSDKVNWQVLMFREYRAQVVPEQQVSQQVSITELHKVPKQILNAIYQCVQKSLDYVPTPSTGGLWRFDKGGVPYLPGQTPPSQVTPKQKVINRLDELAQDAENFWDRRDAISGLVYAVEKLIQPFMEQVDNQTEIQQALAQMDALKYEADDHQKARTWFTSALRKLRAAVERSNPRGEGEGSPYDQSLWPDGKPPF